MNRLWVVGMSGPGSLDDLREMWEPIKHAFSGLIWVLHDSLRSEEARYLESAKGEGKIVHAAYCRRHDFSRNIGLYCGPMAEGEWACDVDVLERIAPVFANSFRDLTGQLAVRGYTAAVYFGKHFMFQFHESLRYQGNPHESLVRDDGQLRGIELSQFYPDERQVRYGVRAEKRPDKYHFVSHYAKYMLFPWGANHALLGLEHRGDVRTLFPQREALRLEFLAEMKTRGFPRTLDGLRTMLSAPLDDTLKSFLNREKVWQDYYRYEILSDKTVRDEHDWTSMQVLA